MLWAKLILVGLGLYNVVTAIIAGDDSEDEAIKNDAAISMLSGIIYILILWAAGLFDG